MLEQIFGAKGDLTVWQECARAVLIFFYGLILVRLAGRRLFGKWSALDIIVSLIIGSSLSRALTGSAPLFETLAATTLLIALHWALAQLSARWRWASRIVEGSAIELARDGELIRRRSSEISESDLAEGLRQRGLEGVEDTSRIVLEPSGKISVIRKK